MNATYTVAAIFSCFALAFVDRDLEGLGACLDLHKRTMTNDELLCTMILPSPSQMLSILYGKLTANRQSHHSTARSLSLPIPVSDRFCGMESGFLRPLPLLSSDVPFPPQPRSVR